MDLMRRLFLACIEEAKKKQELTSLLVECKDRPHLKVGDEDYELGLIDTRPMFVRSRDKAFVNPELVAKRITGLNWK
jgi:hypothetical protein